MLAYSCAPGGIVDDGIKGDRGCSDSCASIAAEARKAVEAEVLGGNELRAEADTGATARARGAAPPSVGDAFPCAKRPPSALLSCWNASDAGAGSPARMNCIRHSRTS